MTSNLFLRDDWESTPRLNASELKTSDIFYSNVYGWLSDKPKDQWMTDPYLFPNEMGDKLAAKVPPVVIVTAEFDLLRYHSREARDLYQKNGKFLHYIEYGGGYHASYENFYMEESNVWQKDFKKLTDYYLQ